MFQPNNQKYFQKNRHRLATSLVRSDYPPTVNGFHTDASGRLRKSNVVVSGAWQGICSLAKRHSNIANINIGLVAISRHQTIRVWKRGSSHRQAAWVSFESISVVLWLYPVGKTYGSALHIRYNINTVDRGYFGKSGATLAAKNNKICCCGMGKQLTFIFEFWYGYNPLSF